MQMHKKMFSRPFLLANIVRQIKENHSMFILIISLCFTPIITSTACARSVFLLSYRITDFSTQFLTECFLNAVMMKA